MFDIARAPFHSLLIVNYPHPKHTQSFYCCTLITKLNTLNCLLNLTVSDLAVCPQQKIKYSLQFWASVLECAGRERVREEVGKWDSDCRNVSSPYDEISFQSGITRIVFVTVFLCEYFSLEFYGSMVLWCCRERERVRSGGERERKREKRQ
jgi:hypothetical protein